MKDSARMGVWQNRIMLVLVKLNVYEDWQFAVRVNCRGLACLIEGGGDCPIS